MALLLALLSILAFLPSLQGGFVYDDEHYILDNPYIESLTPGNLRIILTEPYFGNFHPLHHLLIGIQRAVFGFNAMGWHAVSLLLHAMNTALLYRVLLRLGVAGSVSVAGAAVFAIHPLQAESVAWVSEQKNLLSLVFVLLSLGAYLRARRTGRWPALLVSLIAFVLALAAKVSAVALPPVLLAIEMLSPPSLGVPRGRALLRLGPFLVLAGVWCNLSVLAHGREGFIHPYPGGSLASAVLSIGPVLAAYARLILWPSGLSAAYDLLPATEIPAGQLAAAWAGVGAFLLCATVVAWKERERHIVIGLVWTAASLLPVLNFVPIGTLMHDRYLYGPLCALAPMAVAGIGVLGRPVARGLGGPAGRPFKVAAAALVFSILGAILGSLSVVRSRVWQGEESLWADAVANSPRSAHARYNLGTLWLERGRDDLAEPHLRAALEADPLKASPYQNLGSIHFRQGKYRLAAAEFEAAIKLTPRSYSGWMNLASARAKTGESEAAIAALKQASRIRPEAGKPYLGLGLLLAERNDDVSARDAFEVFLASGDGSEGQRRLAREQLRTLGARIRNPKTTRGAGT